MKPSLLLLLALGLATAACSSETTAPLPSGKWAVLNAGQWDIDPALVTVPPVPKAPR